jgi:hypothetical protein
MCNVGSCGVFSSLENCEGESNGNKCMFVKGECISNGCKNHEGDKNGCERDRLCRWEGSTCKGSKCAKYTDDECKEGKQGCIYQDSHCISGLCSLLSGYNDECEVNSRCKLLFEFNDDNNVDTPICWENNCHNFASFDCPRFGCVVNSSSNLCLFDTCNKFNNNDCNEQNNCVYTYEDGCYANDCESIGTEIVNCELNNKCDVVRGKCEIGCSKDCEGNPYCLKESETCTYDVCSKWTETDCSENEGCIWDNSILFNGVLGLCKSGRCENLLNEESCNSEFNDNKCGFIGGRCVGNPCGEIENGNSCVFEGCIVQNGKCRVDECMKYSRNECELKGLNKCVIIPGLDNVVCVVGNCEMLSTSVSCGFNENRCKNVMNECMENPCENEECISPACSKATDGSDKCIYDSCSQYVSTGLLNNNCLI